MYHPGGCSIAPHGEHMHSRTISPPHASRGPWVRGEWFPRTARRPSAYRSPALPLLAALVAVAMAARLPRADDAGGTAPAFRSPVDVALVDGERALVTANAAAGTVSLVERSTGRLLDERAVGRRPTAVAAAGETRLVVAASESGDLVLLDCAKGALVETGRVHLGFEPRGVAVDPDGRIAYVTLSMGRTLAAVDLAAGRVVASLEVGSVPRHVAISPDGTTLAVSCAGRTEIVIVATAPLGIVSRHRLPGLNPGQPAFAADGRTLSFPWTYDGGGNPSKGNIRRGWVTGSRLGRLRLAPADAGPDGGDAAEPGPPLTGLTLDVSGRAAGDVSAVAIAGDGRRLIVAAGGTHELLRFDGDALPFTQASASEVMDGALAADPARFGRLVVGGRPLGMRLSADGRRLYVANHLLDAVQEIDVDTFVLAATIPLGAGGPPAAGDLVVRHGEAIFFDAARSFEQWYSCHTCHFEGGGNAVTFDTLNDGSAGSYKTVLPLYRLAETGPWTWHGWQTDLDMAVRRSLVETMQGPAPTAEDVAALAAYLASLPVPPNPRRGPDGGLSAAAERGRAIFASDRAACARCHTGELFTSAEVLDVGLSRVGDRYDGFNPPVLAGVSRKTLFMHDGREKSLRAVLTGRHGPDRVSGLPPLDEQELADLVAYLESL